MPSYACSNSAGSNEEFPEDPNVPSEVECCGCCSDDGEDDNISVVSDLSGEVGKESRFAHSCTPDLAEVANMTLHVNYGDLANMASGKPTVERARSLKSSRPALSSATTETTLGEELTWSQLLDDDPQAPTDSATSMLSSNNAISFIWTQGYEETTESLGGGMTPLFDQALSLHQLTPAASRRLTSECSISTQSLSSRLSRRPRPLNALKRLFSRQNEESSSVKIGSDVIICSSNTAARASSHSTPHSSLTKTSSLWTKHQVAISTENT